MLLPIPYNRERAVEYARTWALSRNPLFVDFSGFGGNCTNFVSQCILAGAPAMNYTKTFGWYYISAEDRAPAWSGVDELYRFLSGNDGFAMANNGYGPFAKDAREAQTIDIGDIIQLADESGNYYHSLIISGFTENDILVCAQTNDALDRPLSTYNFSTLRALHIEGANLFFDDEKIYQELLSGTSLPPIPTTL